MKAYFCVQCALWEHANDEPIEEAFWMREAFHAFLQERKEVAAEPKKAIAEELEDLTNVRDVLAGYYGEAAIGKLL